MTVILRDIQNLLELARYYVETHPKYLTDVLRGETLKIEDFVVFDDGSGVVHFIIEGRDRYGNYEVERLFWDTATYLTWTKETVDTLVQEYKDGEVRRREEQERIKREKRAAEGLIAKELRRAQYEKLKLEFGDFSNGE